MDRCADTDGRQPHCRANSGSMKAGDLCVERLALSESAVVADGVVAVSLSPDGLEDEVSVVETSKDRDD